MEESSTPNEAIIAIKSEMSKLQITASGPKNTFKKNIRKKDLEKMQ